MMQWIWDCNYFFKILILIILDESSEKGLLDHMVVLFNFLETSTLFPTVTAAFHLPTNCNVQGFPFITSLSMFVTFLLPSLPPSLSLFLSFSRSFFPSFMTIAILTSMRWHLIVQTVIFQEFICIFLIISDWSIFSQTYCPSACLLWKNLYSCLVLIFKMRGFWVPAVAQWIKGPALPQLGHRSQLRLGFDPWPRNFHMPWVWPKGK